MGVSSFDYSMKFSWKLSNISKECFSFSVRESCPFLHVQSAVPHVQCKHDSEFNFTFCLTCIIFSLNFSPHIGAATNIRSSSHAETTTRALWRATTRASTSWWVWSTTAWYANADIASLRWVGLSCNLQVCKEKTELEASIILSYQWWWDEYHIMQVYENEYNGNFIWRRISYVTPLLQTYQKLSSCP